MIVNPSIIFDEYDSSKNVLAQLCSDLPPLPPVLRYYDDFDQKLHSIRYPSTQSEFDLVINGQRSKLNFGQHSPECAMIYKHIFAFLLAKKLTISTIFQYISNVNHLKPSDVAAIVRAGPLGIGLVWKELRARSLQRTAYSAVKSLLHLLCVFRLNGWSQDYCAFIARTLPLPAVDKYAAVRVGDVFLSVDEEARIVRYLDDIAERINRSQHVPFDTLADAGILLCSYQFAMRPIQIGMLEVRHLRIWNDEISNELSVHLTFHMAKQRGDKKRVPLTRRVKREWAPIFERIRFCLDEENIAGSEKFFQVKSSKGIGLRISTLVRNLINCDARGSAIALRHTAAQRLVDAGASHEELAEFMGHAQTNTGMIYYATSASHAERVNRALGASDLYRRVVKIAHDRVISHEELSKLKSKQQIAAVPHGIPIAGIGGCQSGQPSCPYNPITSCYGCRKFMPLNDIMLHEKVLSDMREIVLMFERSSRADIKSPAYMQLQRTIAEIQTIIAELEDKQA